MKTASKQRGDVSGLEIVVIIAIITILAVVCVGGLNSKPSRLPDVVLPNGEVVEAYGFIRGGRYHTIYTSKGKSIQTDNSSGKNVSTEVTIESNENRQ